MIVCNNFSEGHRFYHRTVFQRTADSLSSSITSAAAPRRELSATNRFSPATGTLHRNNKAAIINCLCCTFVILTSSRDGRSRQRRGRRCRSRVHAHRTATENKPALLIREIPFDPMWISAVFILMKCVARKQ